MIIYKYDFASYNILFLWIIMNNSKINIVAVQIEKTK